MIVHAVVVSYWIAHRSSFRPIRAHLSFMAQCRKGINPGHSVCSACRKAWRAFKILGDVLPKPKSYMKLQQRKPNESTNIRLFTLNIL